MGCLVVSLATAAQRRRGRRNEARSCSLLQVLSLGRESHSSRRRHQHSPGGQLPPGRKPGPGERKKEARPEELGCKTLAPRGLQDADQPSRLSEVGAARFAFV